MLPRLRPLLHMIQQTLASLTNPVPEFRLGVAIDQRAAGHPGQKFRHIRADTGNTRQRPRHDGAIAPPNWVASHRTPVHIRRLVNPSASISG